MQKLVRPMRVALGAEHAADHHLRFRKTGTQHVHERDGAALANVAAVGTEVCTRRGMECLLEPRRGVRRIPAGGAAAAFKRDFGLVRRVVFQQGLEFLHRRAGVDQRRQAQRQLEGGERPQHVAGIFHRRKAFGTGHAQGRLPGAIQQCLHRVGGGRQCEGGRAAAIVVRPRKTLVQLVAQDRRRGARLCHALRRYFAMEAGGQQPPGGAVFKPVQHVTHDAKARRHQARGVPGMHAFSQDFDLERAAGQAAQ